jgi:hypothetical protein
MKEESLIAASEISVLVSAVISIIILVCFFYLCSYVAAIKKLLYNQKTDIKNNMNLYLKSMTFGDKNEAKKHLENYIWNLLQQNDQYSLNNTNEDREKRHKFLKERYNHLFENLGIEFPKPLAPKTFEVFKKDLSINL